MILASAEETDLYNECRLRDESTYKRYYGLKKYQFIPDVQPYGSNGAGAVSTPSSSALNPPRYAVIHCHRCPPYRLVSRLPMMAEISILCQAKATEDNRTAQISRFLERSTARSDYGKSTKGIIDRFT